MTAVAVNTVLRLLAEIETACRSSMMDARSVFADGSVKLMHYRHEHGAPFLA